MIIKKMNRKFKFKNIMLISLLVLFVFTCVIGIVSYANVFEIEKVLKSEDYNYLSDNAKDFIKENYELTGSILLTEKNKEENKPYLNPLYVNYLNMDEEDKENLSYIPAVTVVDFVPTNDVQGAELTEYDLRDHNLVTPNRDQGSLGLCWAFATASTLETSIMIKNETTYNADTTQLISERQLDYATSVDGIKDYDNEYVKYVQREVGSGGNFYISTIALANGVSVADYGWAAYDDTDKEPKELEKVLSYSNSLYEVTGTLNMPVFVDSYYSSEVLEEARLEHINLIKQAIEKYGSAVVATYYSDACMHYEDGNENPLLNVNSACYSSSDGHAMTVIGWDDNYEYDYCVDTKQHVDSVDGCTNVVTGKGAWILKNSWGTNDANPYLAYTSQKSQFHLITSIKSAAEKDWDNNYVVGTNAFTSESTNVFGDQARPVLEEKLKYIKLMTAELSGEYSIQFKLADGTLTDVFKVTINSPGLVTLDVSGRNFTVNEDSEIIISGGEFVDTISIFTEDIITTQEVGLDTLVTTEFKNLTDRRYFETKNIPSGQNIEFKFFDSESNDVTDKVTVTNNKVVENNLNPLFEFDPSLGGATYEVHPITTDGEILNIVYVDVPQVYTLPGSGTEEDPYLVASESDLNQIRYNLDAHYKLTSSIQLSEEWKPIGTLEEPFRGSIDGNGQNIKNLVINADTEDPVAFIAYYLPKYHYDIQTPIDASYTEDSYIRNMLFENAVVTNTGDAAVLIGKILYDNSGAPETAFNVDQATLNMENIKFYDAEVTSSNGNAGTLAASIKVVASGYDKPYLNINNTYDSSRIKGYKSSGYIGYIDDTYLSGSGIMLGLKLTNFQFSTILDPYDEEYADNLMHSPIIGGVYGNVGVELSSYIINTIFADVDYFGNFAYYKSNYAIGYYDGSTSTNVSVGMTNGYYVTKFNNENNANTYVSASEIKDMNLYTDWTDFETYWNISTYEGIQRLPLLNGVDSNYTKLEDINLELYDSVSLLDYIDGTSDFQYIELVEAETGGLVADVQYNMVDPNKDTGYYDDISIDALGVGTVTVRIISNYDGFDKEININVTAPEVEQPLITYYKDGVDSETYTQLVTANNSFSLIDNQFTKKGFSFECWSTTPDYRDGSECYTDAMSMNGINSNLNLYAQWVGDTYKLKFDANGGTGEMAEKTFTYVGEGHSVSITENAFTKEGYTFNGWNTQPEGNGVSFPNRGSISHTMWTNADLTEITLYAQWKVKDYSITYNANGGSGSMEPTEGAGGSTVMIKYNIFIKVGKDFNGWNTEPDGSGTSYTEGQNITLNSDMTLYAQWIDSFTYSIKDYSEDKTNKYIDLIAVKTSVNDFKDKFTLGTGVTVEVDIGTKSYVYTGSKTKIYRNGNLIAEYTNIVRGDINGDGNVSAMDYVKIKNHIMGSNKITDPLLIKATDANQDNKISAMDYVRIKNIIMGGAK